MASVPLNRGKKSITAYTIEGSQPRNYISSDNRQSGRRLVPRPRKPVTPLVYRTVNFTMHRVQGSRDVNNNTVYPSVMDRGVAEIGDKTMSGAILQSEVVGPALIIAGNRAYSKLVDLVHGQRADLGTAAVELGSSVDMIRDRAIWLAKSYQQLRKGNFQGFLNNLGMQAKPKHRRTRWTRPKDASSLWLEYWMGWAPSVGDIYNATDVILRGPRPPTFQIRAGARQPVQVRLENKGDKTSFMWSGNAFVHNGARVKVSNPNIALLGELGLLNPAQIAWNVVPFSFMVDWFGNIGQVLGSYSDFAGYELDRVWTSRSAQLEMDATGRAPGRPPLLFTASGSMACMDRITMIQKPILKFTMPNRLSVTRALTSISLVTSIFSKG